MGDVDRIRAAAETAQHGLWGWLLDGLEMDLPSTPDEGGDIPVAVANLLVAVADEDPMLLSGRILVAALALADLILGDGDA